MKIVTDYWRKPIPTNKFDWSAVDDDTYDGAPDTHPPSPIGYGATEADAVADLMEQFAERKICRYACAAFPMCGCDVEALNEPKP